MGGGLSNVLYAARALGGLCNNSLHKFAKSGENGEQEHQKPVYETEGESASYLMFGVKGMGGWIGVCGDLMHVDWIDRIIFVAVSYLVVFVYLLVFVWML